MTNQKKYRDWNLLDTLPDGWVFDKNVGSPVCGYDFATNGKSPLKGQKRALVFVGRKRQIHQPSLPKLEEVKPQKPVQEIDGNYVRTVNDLARKRFEQRLLADIAIDLTICEIEGWCKMEYILELRRLLASIARRKSVDIPLSDPLQTTLF